MDAAPVEIGRFTFTEAEITRFALNFDPQPVHVDAEAARHAPFGGLVASGWHVVCVWMGFFVRTQGTGGSAPAVPSDHPRIVSPVGVGFGLRALRWTAPVHAGDRLVFLTEVLEARASGSRPGWTIVRRRNSARREDGAEVMAFELSHLAPEGEPAARIRG
ncbi:MaoC/PaaZ C-terminal domain-containing protein [Xanthobacter agilis]|uniref:Acyl dehydratase n=1 Tax=Xanthobacter agilis TaxID=47492 RepID=A0ABU0LFG8_XANAG|nr:MaoC/PaaZ C-terminal domain-containing protein [Xanthobacter agilis]MDQ0505882.1 acyl dehydratase [Xanthobacter agilis]